MSVAQPTTTVRDDLPDGTVTLLLTDIEGSTRTLHRLGEARYAEALAAHRDIIRAAARAHGGVEVDTQGDAFFMVFSDPLACVSAAADIQRGLHAHEWDAGGELRVRMGVHTGNPQRTDEGYVGMDVHAAARIASAGHGGQVLLSAGSAEQIRDHLDPAITLRDLGQQNLKDLEQLEHVYQLVVEGLASDFPLLRTAETQPNNLPASPTAFVGRADMVAEVRDLLLEPRTRAVTLLGPGGVGKSRLSLRVASEVLHSMKDGAFVVSLAPIRDAALVVPEIAKTLSIREVQDVPLLDTLIEGLREKTMLLLLDNFEQVPEAARDVGSLLAACRGIKVLTTSRQPLRLSGERGFPVAPFAIPLAGDKLSFERIANLEVVQLFIDRAQAVMWDFELDEDNAEEVLDICRKVDGLPLCIELATAKLYAMTLFELNTALEDRLGTLDEGHMDLLDHQQTLRDLIAWSYEALEEGEQLLWRSLGVFAGGASKAAAAAVCEVNPREFDRGLQSLASKSLVKLEFQGGTGAEKVISIGRAERRIVLLETLRAFALEELELKGELAELRARHLDWFVSFSAQAEKEIKGKQSELWLRQLDQERANLRDALEYALEADVAAALRVSGSLFFYWYLRGLLTEGNDWLQRSLAADDGGDADARGAALLAVASMQRYLDSVSEAEAAATDALELYRLHDNEQGIASSLAQLGVIYEHQGKQDLAIKTLEDAQQRLRELGSNERLSFALVCLGSLRQLKGELDSAAAHYEENLELSRARDDRTAMLSSLINLGEIAQLRGDAAQARQSLLDSLALARSLGHRMAIAYCLEVLAALSFDTPELAGRMFGAAAQIREDINAPVESWNRDRYEKDVATLGEQLSADELAAAWQRGRDTLLDDLLGEIG